MTEGGKVRTFEITMQPPRARPRPRRPAAPAAAGGKSTPVFSPFEGKVELVDIHVKVGDSVTAGQVVAAVEAMKAKHDVKSPCDGTVLSIDAALGSEVSAGKPILTLG